jgi:hypothetical protein
LIVKDTNINVALGAFIAILSVAASTPTLAQETPTVSIQSLATGTAIPMLMFFTLGSVLLIAIGSFVMFLRKRSNRGAASRALLGKGEGRA